MTHLPNDFVIHDYQRHLKQALGRHDRTIDATLRHIRQFERLTDHRAFDRVDREAIIDYKQSLIAACDHDAPLSASTLVHSFGAMKAFFKWLVTQPGYRSMPRDLHEYFTPETRVVKIANAPKEKRVPTKQDLAFMIEMMPVSTPWERRDRAILAFLFLSGVRDGALVTLRLKHIDIERQLVIQDAREVATKASKTMRTLWFPVRDPFERIDWINELRSAGADGDAPLFPRAFQNRWPGSPRQAFEFLSSAAPCPQDCRSRYRADPGGTVYAACRPLDHRPVDSRLGRRYPGRAKGSEPQPRPRALSHHRNVLWRFGGRTSARGGAIDRAAWRIIAPP